MEATCRRVSAQHRAPRYVRSADAGASQTGGRRRGVVEVSCRRMSLFLKDTHESHDSISIRKPLETSREPATARALTPPDCNVQATVVRCARLTHLLSRVHGLPALCSYPAYGKHTARRRTRPIGPRRSRHRPPAPPPATGRNCTARYVFVSTRGPQGPTRADRPGPSRLST